MVCYSSSCYCVKQSWFYTSFPVNYDWGIFTDEPLVVSAPTGSGKTVLFELAIVRLLDKITHLQHSDDIKIVYSKYNILLEEVSLVLFEAEC